MKLRLAPDSIRLRLDPAELPVLDAAGRLDAWCALPGGAQLGYGVELGDATTVRFEGGQLVLTVARDAARPWLDGAIEGVHADVVMASGDTLHLAVERDRGAKPRP